VYSRIEMARGATSQTFIRVNYEMGDAKADATNRLSSTQRKGVPKSPTHLPIMVESFSDRQKSDPRPSTRQSRNQSLSELW
jgi:hypothetical protein